MCTRAFTVAFALVDASVFVEFVAVVVAGVKREVADRFCVVFVGGDDERYVVWLVFVRVYRDEAGAGWKVAGDELFERLVRFVRFVVVVDVNFVLGHVFAFVLGWYNDYILYSRVNRPSRPSKCGSA